MATDMTIPTERPTSTPLLERIFLQKERPATEPQDKGSEAWAAWNSTTLTTYGYPLGRVITVMARTPEQPPRVDSRGFVCTDDLPDVVKRPVHDPFGFSDAPRFHVSDYARGLWQGRTAIWQEAHASAVSRATGKVGGPALLEDWAAAWEEAEERQKAEEARLAAEYAAHRKTERRENLPSYVFRQYGAPGLAVKAWVEGVKPTPALQAARECVAQLSQALVERKQPILLLTGQTGTGKTTAAVIALMEHTLATCDAHQDTKGVKLRIPTTFSGRSRMKGPAPVSDWTAPEGAGLFDGDSSIVFWNASTMSRRGLYGQEASETIEKGKDVEVLVVDDLGVEFLAEGGPWQATLDEVLDARYRDARITILTTNLDWETFSKRYGARISDRIRQSGRVFACGVDSMRRPPERPSADGR